MYTPIVKRTGLRSGYQYIKDYLTDNLVKESRIKRGGNK
jgi:hypothetical protein